MKRRLAIAITIVLCGAASAEAQARKKSWEAAAGVAWLGGMDLGTSVATLERPGGGTFELFRAETSQEQGLGAAASVSFYVTPRLAVEAAFSYARPGLSTTVTADTEGAPAVTSTIGLQQYAIEAGARWYFGRSFGGFQPFARAGGGWMRQLDEDSAHLENGASAHAGAGVDRVLVERSGKRGRRIGLRFDARVIGRSGGIDIDSKLRVGAAAGAQIFLAF
jgi:opacity protein-like surface antigen